MIALLLAVAAPASAAPLLAPIGRQALPARGCAAYLWSPTDRQLVAMASADPATLRIAPGGRTVDLARSGEDGTGNLGFARSTQYRGGDVTASLSMEILLHEGLSAGAQVPTGTLRVDQPGRDTVVMPVAGLIGCAAG